MKPHELSAASCLLFELSCLNWTSPRPAYTYGKPPGKLGSDARSPFWDVNVPQTNPGCDGSGVLLTSFSGHGIVLYQARRINSKDTFVMHISSRSVTPRGVSMHQGSILHVQPPACQVAITPNRQCESFGSFSHLTPRRD